MQIEFLQVVSYNSTFSLVKYLCRGQCTHSSRYQFHWESKCTRDLDSVVPPAADSINYLLV